MRYTLDGLVIRETAWGENDKRIVLLSADRGCVSVLAKGARSLRSKYMNATSLFTYGNYEIAERSGYAWLSGASVTEPFFGIRDSIERLALASYVVELAGELTGEGEPAESILRLTLNTLYAIAKDFKPLPQIKATYELRVMSESGYMPDLSACDVCGCERAECFYLDVMNGVIRCTECLNRLDARIPVSEDDARTNHVLVPMDPSVISAARYVLEAPVEKVLSVLLSPATMTDLAKMGETYAVHHLEKRLTSLDFYDDVMRGAGSAAVFNPSVK